MQKTVYNPQKARQQLISPLRMKTQRGLMTLTTAPRYQRLPTLRAGLSSLIAVIRILF